MRPILIMTRRVQIDTYLVFHEWLCSTDANPKTYLQSCWKYWPHDSWRHGPNKWKHTYTLVMHSPRTPTCHNITKLFSCVLWAQVYSEHNSSLILRSHIYGSTPVVTEFFLTSIYKSSKFLIATSFFGKRSSPNRLVLLWSLGTVSFFLKSLSLYSPLRNSHLSWTHRLC